MLRGIASIAPSAISKAHNRYENFEYPTLTMITRAEDPHVGVDTNYKNIEPRIGFAYSAGRGVVVLGVCLLLTISMRGIFFTLTIRRSEAAL
jgi:hypothetical protein